ncbi:MAG: sulfite exporter TauE/SafE family protein [Xanthobacteraceae bacterium]
MPEIQASLPIILACAAALTLAGAVKGVLALGLPLVGLPLLTLVVDVPTAVAVLMIPLVLSNLIQAVEGEGTLVLLRRFWPLILCLMGGILIGTALFVRLDRQLLMLTVGTLTILLSTAAILQPQLAIPSRYESWLGPVTGLVAGVIGGMSTLFGPLLALYVVGLRPPRDVFVKAISLLYLIAASTLTVGGIAQGATNARLLIWSAAAMIPVYLGMLIGRRIRPWIDPERFRLMVLGVVWLTGANLIRIGLGF